MDKISPKYQMQLIKSIEQALWQEYGSYKEMLQYILKWHETSSGFNSYINYTENFKVCYKDNDEKNIDVYSTLHGIDGETLLKMAIDLGVETPDFIPSIPVFRNEIKSNYQTASKTFEKAFKCIENDPSTAIGLANSALESIVKEILQDKRLKIQYNPKDTLYKLTQNILKAFGMFPSENIPMEIKTICSNLLGIGKSIEDLRSTKTEFHGKVNGDYIVSESVFVYLCFNSICTVGLFLLSYYKEIFPKQQIEQPESIDDVLPF